jgi:hypothetical protein
MVIYNDHFDYRSKGPEMKGTRASNSDVAIYFLAARHKQTSGN